MGCSYRSFSSSLLILVACLGFGGAAFANTAGITYAGRIIRPNGTAETSNSVQFRIQIRTAQPEACLMYEEIQVKDLSQSEGAFALTLNDGSAVPPNSEPFTLDQVFQNVGSYTFPAGKCVGASIVSFSSLASRQILVSFRTPSMGSWEHLPSQQINYVPMALEAVSVGGTRGSELFRVSNGAGGYRTLPAWESTDYDRLVNIVTGTENIAGSAGGFTGSLAGDVTGFQGNTIVSRIQGNTVSGTAPLSGQVLTWNAGASRWEPANVPVAGNPDWADITGKPTTFAPGGTASGDLSGTYPNPTIAANAVSGGKIADGGVAFSKLAAGSASGQVLLYNGTSWSASKLNFNDLVNNSGMSPWPGACGVGQYVTWVSAVDGFQCVNLPATDWADITNKPTTVAVNTISSGAGLYLTYEPNGAACTPGQVLKWNNNRWECGADNDSATGVTSVGVSVPAYMTSTGGPVTSTGTIALGFGSQAQNSVFAGPSSGSGAPSFRELSILDIRADSAGSPAFWDISGPCAAGEMPTYSSALDQVSCQPYSITSAQVTGALGYTPLQSSDLSGYVPTSRTVTAGTGLSGGGDLSANRTLSIAAGGVGTTELASNAVTTAKIADGQVTDAKITGVAVNKIASGAGLYLTYQPDGSACTPGQVLKWNNSRWECGADNDSATAETDPTVEAYAKQAPSADFTTPGDVLTIANNAITTAKINDGAVTTAKIADSQVTTAKIADSQVTTAKIGDSQVTNAKIVGMSADKLTSGAGLYLTYQPDGSACTPGQVLKWNNSRWECGADNDSATAETDPTVEAFAKQAPNSSDFSVTGNELTLNTVPIAKGGTGATSRADAINNLLPDQNLENGKILQTDGTNVSWVPAPATGVTSVDVSVPAYMTSTGGAITSSGTIALGFASQAQNSVFAGPTSGSGAPAFRSLFIADIKANSAGNPAFWNLSGACAAGEMPTHSSVTDQVTCEPYAITSSQVTTALGYTPLQSSDISGLVPNTRTVTAGTGLTGGGDLSADRSFAVNVGTGANQIPQLDGSGKLAGSVIPDLSWSQITSGTPTTLAGYGITNAVTNAGNTPSIQAGLDGAKPTAGTAGRLYVSTDTQQIYRDDGSDWVLVGSSGGGTVTNIATGTGLTGGPITETGTISIAAGGVSSTELASNAVTTAKIADGQVTNAKIAGMSADKLTSGAGLYLTYQPDGTACTPGQVLKWNNSRWECAADNDTTTAETDPTVEAFAKQAPSADFSVPGGELTLNTVPVEKGGTGATTQIGAINNLLPSQATHTGKLLQTDGTNVSWVAPPATGVTSVDVSVPAYMTSTGGPVTSTGTIAVGFASQAQGSVFAGPASGSGAPAFRNLFIADIKANSAGNPAFWNIAGACAAGEMPTYSSVTDQVACAAYALTSSQVTTALGYTPLQSSDISGLVPNTRTVTAGTGLTGGGDLSANRTLAVNVGTGANQIVQLNASSQLPAVSGELLTNLNADNLASGTVPAARLPAAVVLNGGNTVTADMTVGTNSNHSLSLRANNANRLTITPSGQVGIGATSPTHTLHLANGSGEEGTNGIFIQDPTANATFGGSVYFDDRGGLNLLKVAVLDAGVESGYIAIDRVTGRVGINNDNPSARLHVNGQMVSSVHNNAAGTTFNFANGNHQYTSASCGAMTLQNMVDGGSYTLAVQGTTSGTCTFTHSGETFRFRPANGPTQAGSETVYTFIKMGGTIYVSWITGFQ